MSKYLAGCSGDMQKQYTGIELNFFTADSMRLCFHFVLNTGLIAQGCFHYHRTAFQRVKKDLLCSSPHCKSKRTVHSTWKRTQPGKTILTNPRDVPHHMASRSAYKVGQRKRKGGDPKWQCLTSQVIITCDGALLSWRWLNTCFALLACEALALPIQVSLSQPMIYLHFTLLIVSPCHRGDWVAVRGPAACWGKNTQWPQVLKLFQHLFIPPCVHI